MTKRARQIIEFLKEADKLKDVQRGNRVASGRPENPAEHSWHLCLALWLFKEELGLRFNLEHAFKIALAHDLVEIYAAEIPYFSMKKAKKAKVSVNAGQRKKSLGSFLDPSGKN